MKKTLYILALFLLIPFISATDSTDPNDYFFYDDMESGTVNVSKYVGSALSMSTTSPYNGTYSLELAYTNDVTCDNKINNSAFTSTEYSTPFCLDTRGWYTGNIANNLETGFIFDAWANGIMFDSNPGASSANLTYVDNANWFSFGQNFGDATWGYTKVCFTDGWASSGTTTAILFDKNGVNTRNESTQPRSFLDNICLHNREGSGRVTRYDNIRIWNYTAYGSNPPQEVPPSSQPYASVQVVDLYDNATLEGLTVYIGTDSNTTDATGLAVIYDFTGLNYTVDGGTNYFNVSGTAIENETVTDEVYGAFVLVSAENIINESLSNFTLLPDESSWENTTITGSTYIYLKPNAQNNVSIYVYDGNYTYNSTEQTYRNLTWLLNTTGKDTGSYTIEGLYQSLMQVNVSLGLTTTYISNHTTNVSGDIDYSDTTTDFNLYFPVMWSNYSMVTSPEGYSLSYKNVSIGAYNYTYNVTIPAYAFNSFYINILDEITQLPITQTMILEVITETSANSYSTNNGSIAFEGLTPDGYTLRYRSNLTNYSERNYYQTLVNQNYYEITLYGIALTESTPMVVSVYDTSDNPIEGANVKLLRYYVSCNCYSVVEMRYTGASGDAYFVADAYDGNYKFSVDYQNTTYFLSTSPENLIPDENDLIEKEITINLGTAYFQSYRALPNMGLQLVYNNETKALSFSWNDPSGIVTQGCLYASYIDGIDYTAVTPSCENSSTGSVFLVLNDSVRSWRYYSTIETSTTYSEYVPYSGIIDQLNNIWYQDISFGAFMGSLFIVALGLLFSFSAVGVVLTSVVGVVFMTALGLFSVGGAFVTGIATIVLGISMYLMRR